MDYLEKNHQTKKGEVMKPRTAKAKGRKLQNTVRDALRRVYIEKWTKFPKLEEDDIKSQTMGMCGEDIILSPAARKLIPYSFECKNVEKLNLWKAIEQCEDNAIKIDGTMKGEPVVVFKKNGKMPYVAISLEHFMDLITRQR